MKLTEYGNGKFGNGEMQNSTDACKSYQLTWAIREASERSRKQKTASAANLA